MTVLFCILTFIIGFILGIKFKRVILSLFYKKSKVENDETQVDEEIEDFEDADLKMVFLVRDDLKMGAGKIAAQVGHAAVGLIEKIYENGSKYYKKAYNHWSEYGAKKIVLRAKDEEELKTVRKQCKGMKIPYTMISDAGHTQVDPGTVTVLGIGPEISEKLNKITGQFKLMR